MTKKLAIGTLALFVVIGVSARCQNEQTNKSDSQANRPLIKEDTLSQFAISTSAFAEGELVPVKHTCDGQNVSPALKWTAPPESTKSLALICDDPDAPGGTWVHWVLFNIPAGITELPEGVSIKDVNTFEGAAEGKNDFGKTSYGGPCPPRGPAHRYFFKLYALDAALALKKGATKADVEKAMVGHILAQAQVMGKYKR